MSTISQSEMNAGISRRALESLNGNGKRPKTISEILCGFRVTRVIDSPMRMLDVLEKQGEGGGLFLRNTDYLGTKAEVIQIHLDYHEAQSLSSALRDLEPPEEKTNGKARP